MPFYVKMTAVVWCVMIVLSGNCRADDERLAQPDVAAEVSRLMTDLDANRLSVRRAAEQRLLKLGPAALPHLPPPELIPQPGVRQTVTRLRIQLENAQARLSAKASLVTLSGRFALPEILRKISEQTGNRINAAQVPAASFERTIDVDYKGVPFWNVIDQLAGEWKLQHRSGATPEVLELFPATIDDSEVAVTYSGPFRIAVVAARRRAEFQDVRVSLTIAAEPRLRPLFMTQMARKWHAETSDGRQLPVKNPTAVLELPLSNGGRLAQLSVDFTGAETAVDKLTIDGEVTFTIAAGEEPIRFTDLKGGEGTARRRGVVTVILDKVHDDDSDPQGKDPSIEVAVMYDAQGPAFESHRTWIYHNRVFLEAADGTRVEFAGGQRTSLSRTGAVVIEYPFPGLAHPLSDYRFVYVAPTLIINVPVTIRFDDLQVED